MPRVSTYTPRRRPNGTHLARAAALLIAVAATPAAHAESILLTTDCEDGRSVCWKNAAAPSERPVPDARPTIPESVPPTSDPTVLSLSNADLDRPVERLTARWGPAEAPARDELAVAAPPLPSSEALEELRDVGDGESDSLDWGPIDDLSETDSASEVWTYTSPSNPPALRDVETCLARALEGGAEASAARSVCDALFLPGPAD